MTRKDYQLLARHISVGYRDAHISREGVEIIADALFRDNGRFDHDRFYSACGIGEDER